MKDLFERLNPAQQEVVRHNEGPLLVLAGPGSGKTRVVTHRIAWLLTQGVYPRQIAALTFTNKAAEEMKKRVNNLVPGANVWMGTFHGFCASLLRIYSKYAELNPQFTIYDADASQRLLDGLINKKQLPSGINSKQIGTAISWAKNQMVLPDEYQAGRGSLLGREVERIYPQYQKALEESNAVDFDDLLLKVALLLKNQPDIRRNMDARFRYMLIDEYQDTNLVQYTIARALSVDYPNLAVTGDPDQSIYGWRGADLNNILHFEKDFPTTKIIRLEQNYRSTQPILTACSHLIRKNNYRKDKELFTDRLEGERPCVSTYSDQNTEAAAIAREMAEEIKSGIRRPGDYAVFYRTNALSRNLEHALTRFSVPFKLIRGQEFFGRKEIKDIIAYLQVIYNRWDNLAVKRIINLPTRGIGQTSIGRLEEFAKQHGISLFQAIGYVEKISSISKRTQTAITRFGQMMNRFLTLAPNINLEPLLSVILEESGMIKSLSGDETEEGRQRLANVQELLTEAKEFDRLFNELQQSDTLAEESADRLGRFLERTALVSDTDAQDTEGDYVSLMTLHAAKGLEFPVVYLIALEENILPHERTTSREGNDPLPLEEERRLLFVGMTRAKEVLRLSKTTTRDFRGTRTHSIASRFLFDIPTHLMEYKDWNPDDSSEIPLAPPAAPLRTSRTNNNFGDVIIEPVGFSKTKTVVPDLSDPETGDYWEDEEYLHEKRPRKERKEILPNAITLGSKLLRKVGIMGSGSEGQATTAGQPESKLPELQCGALVKHDEYGIGVVKELSGPREDRIATVEFLSQLGVIDLSATDTRLRVIAPKKT